MRSHITAPAPRFLLRAYVIESLLKRHFERGERVDSICEVGAGLGDLASYLMTTLRPERVDLYEASDSARAILERRFEHDDGVRIGGSFDVAGRTHKLAVCCEVLEHIDEDEDFLRLLSESIERGGFLIGSVPAYSSKWQAGDVLVGHYRRYEADELEAKLARAGFSDIELHTYGFPLINLLHPARELYYRRELRRRTDEGMDSATRKSGIARRFVRAFNTPLVYNTTRLFDLFRHLPAKERLDDGFVFVCRKTG